MDKVYFTKEIESLGNQLYDIARILQDKINDIIDKINELEERSDKG